MRVASSLYLVLSHILWTKSIIFLALSTNRNAVVEKPKRNHHGLHLEDMQARPCNPFSRCSKQMGASHWPDFGMVQRSISKVETGKPAALRSHQQSGCRSTPASEVQGAGHAGGLLEESSEFIGSGHQTAPQYFIEHSKTENGRQTSAI